MNKKVKKLLTIGVCTATALMCTINAGAAEVTEQETETSQYSSFKVINSTKNIPANKLYLSTFNQSSDTINLMKLDSLGSTKTSDVYYFKDYVDGGYISVENNTEYEIWSGLRKSSGNAFGKIVTRNFSDFYGKYQKVRIKLSDFNSYFNSDGSSTHESLVDSSLIDYHFGLPEKVNDATYYSSLLLFSGAAFTSVTPDKNGEVEFYVSTKIGVSTYFSTDFGFTTSRSSGGGGGTYRTIAICKGNAKTNNNTVSVDDATYIQLYLVSLLDEGFNSLQKFNADVDNDDDVTIKDATYIQLYLAKLL